jgi:hypothetical protein
MLLLISAVAVPGFAQSYSCPDDNNGHCYGIVRFFAPGPPGTVGQFTGYATDVSIVPLNGGNGEINDEMWMGQFNNPACPGLNGNICWVEVGLSAGANAGGCSIPNNQTHFFGPIIGQMVVSFATTWGRYRQVTLGKEHG